MKTTLITIFILLTTPFIAQKTLGLNELINVVNLKDFSEINDYFENINWSTSDLNDFQFNIKNKDKNQEIRISNYKIEGKRGNLLVSYEYDDLTTHKKIKDKIKQLNLKKEGSYNTGQGIVNHYKGRNYTIFSINNIYTDYPFAKFSKFATIIIKNEFNNELQHENIYKPKKEYKGEYLEKKGCLFLKDLMVDSCGRETILNIYTPKDKVYIIRKNIKCNGYTYHYVWYDGFYGYMYKDAFNGYCEE